MLTQSRFQTILSAIVVVTLLSGCGIFKKKDKNQGFTPTVVEGETDIGAGTPLSFNELLHNEERRDHSVQFSTVLFGYDSTQILPGEMSKLSEVVAYLRSSPESAIRVDGHCDERGSREYNMALGERRALAVRAYLIGQGIDPNRVGTFSHGEESPAEFGHHESAWRQNRRAEFKAYK